MRARIITVTQKVPTWITQGFQSYQTPLSRWCKLEVVEIDAKKRSANEDIGRITVLEGEKILAAIKSDFVVALDLQGKLLSTEQLATSISEWQQRVSSIDFIVGGADGLSPSCLKRADFVWSLSPLTFPHFFIRVIVAEQLFRAFGILHHHPYHR